LGLLTFPNSEVPSFSLRFKKHLHGFRYAHVQELTSHHDSGSYLLPSRCVFCEEPEQTPVIPQTLIGIQTPETSAERNVSLVKAAAKEKGFQFPVLIDLQNKNWDAWGNTMWPTVYVVDKKGYIRSWWQGELNWQGATGDKTIETLIDQLLAE